MTLICVYILQLLSNALLSCVSVAYPGFFFGGGGGGGYTNSAEDRGQTERGTGCIRPLVRGFTQFVNERNSYSD
jgi:hypothetical protein